MRIVWKSPVSSTSFLDGGIQFKVGGKRRVSISFQFEADDDNVLEGVITFSGVDYYSCTYLSACDLTLLGVYDQIALVNESAMLEQIERNLIKNNRPVEGLKMYQVMFDDGPLYEVVCRDLEYCQSNVNK
jgi:hypothetical protein